MNIQFLTLAAGGSVHIRFAYTASTDASVTDRVGQPDSPNPKPQVACHLLLFLCRSHRLSARLEAHFFLLLIFAVQS